MFRTCQQPPTTLRTKSKFLHELLLPQNLTLKKKKKSYFFGSTGWMKHIYIGFYFDNLRNKELFKIDETRILLKLEYYWILLKLREAWQHWDHPSHMHTGDHWNSSNLREDKLVTIGVVSGWSRFAETGLHFTLKLTVFFYNRFLLNRPESYLIPLRLDGPAKWKL